MWIEELKDGRFKYFERYKDPYTEKWRRVSIILEKNTRQMQRQASTLLQEKIRAKQNAKPTKDLTFGQLYDLFYEEWQLTVKNSTARNTKSIDKQVFQIIQPNFKLSKIDHLLIQKGINTLAKQNKGQSYLVHIKSRIHKILDYGLRSGFLEQNPTQRVLIPKRPQTLEERTQKQNKFLTKEEVDSLLQILRFKSSNFRYTAMIEILYLTGMRIGEFLALREKDIDFENKQIHITGTYEYNQKVRETTKTESSTRTIDVPESVLNAINDCLKWNKRHYGQNNPSFNPEEYIFITKSGYPPTLSTILVALRKAASQAGISKKVSTHIFRHTHISLLAEKKIPLKQVMERVGHSDYKTTLQIYSHVTDQMKDELIDELEAIKF